MAVDEIYKYLRQMQKRYKKQDERNEAGCWTMEAITAIYKSLIRLMNSNIVRRKRIRQSGVVNSGEVKQDVRDSLSSFEQGQFVMKAVVVNGGESWWECSGVCSGVYGE